MQLYWLNQWMTAKSLTYVLLGLLIFAIIALLVGLSGTGS